MKVYTTILLVFLFGFSAGNAQTTAQSTEDKDKAVLDEKFFEELIEGGLLSDKIVEKLNSDQLFDIIQMRLERPNRISIHGGGDLGDILPTAIAFFLTLLAFVFIPLYLRYRKMKVLHGTLSQMIEKGIDIPIELIAPATMVKKKSDQRRGVLFLSLGIGISLFFLFSDGYEAGMWTLGIIPLFVGFGYFIVWKTEKHKHDSGDEDND